MGAPTRESSPSNDSVVSLGPEEDIIMADVEVQGSPERMEAGEIPVVNESTYVLIHGYSFSFGLGDLRLWFRLPSTGVATDSIAGIFRLLQSNYRVDYFFEVRNTRDAELLRQAGKDHARSAGARFMSREGFERAVMGLRRDGVDASPPPERPKLPSFKKTRAAESSDQLRMPTARSEPQDKSLRDDPRAPRRHGPLKELEDEAPRSLGYPKGDLETNAGERDLKTNRSGWASRSAHLLRLQRPRQEVHGPYPGSQAKAPLTCGLALLTSEKTTIGFATVVKLLGAPSPFRLARSFAPKHGGFTFSARVFMMVMLHTSDMIQDSRDSLMLQEILKLF
ncbi:hypothetical protein B0H14DRAFT_2613141 [Mycena olivaceomarginata]|nr:hypothetical protein B0H14DRAFT_2613141 [Mycena olivaceomarginata]